MIVGMFVTSWMLILSGGEVFLLYFSHKRQNFSFHYAHFGESLNISTANVPTLTVLLSSIRLL